MSSPDPTHAPDRAPPALPRLYRVQEVADALGISVSHMRREIRLRKIAAVHLGSRVRISSVAIEEYLAKCCKGAR